MEGLLSTATGATKITAATASRDDEGCADEFDVPHTISSISLLQPECNSAQGQSNPNFTRFEIYQK
ncbi:MAG: hypothetical protein ACOY90_15060 [Candidatus Zhuqueibacterota bacterium]